MILIGRYFSPFVRRVGATLQHYGFDYEHRPIKAAGAEQDEIRRHGNPLGRVPVLVLDDGTPLADSAVILEYLDTLVDEDKMLVPRSGAARFELLSLIAIANGAAEKAIAVFSEKMRPEHTQHEPAIQNNLRQAKDGFEYLEQRCQGPWFGGERISQLDITVVSHWEFLRAGAPSVHAACHCPAIESLSQRAGELPLFQSTMPEI